MYTEKYIDEFELIKIVDIIIDGQYTYLPTGYSCIEGAQVYDPVKELCSGSYNSADSARLQYAKNNYIDGR